MRRAIDEYLKELEKNKSQDLIENSTKIVRYGMPIELQTYIETNFFESNTNKILLHNCIDFNINIDNMDNWIDNNYLSDQIFELWKKNDDDKECMFLNLARNKNLGKVFNMYNRSSLDSTNKKTSCFYIASPRNNKTKIILVVSIIHNNIVKCICNHFSSIDLAHNHFYLIYNSNKCTLKSAYILIFILDNDICCEPKYERIYP